MMLNKFFLLTVGVGGLLLVSIAQAQNDNPTGAAGAFNPGSTTGGSYDSYTANATRTVTDITVAGAVGNYPLQWSRTMNSRGVGLPVWGMGGGWRHSYSWAVGTEEDTGSIPAVPTSYSVAFPDGRSVVFDRVVAGDSCLHGPLGVAERFEKLNTTTKLAYLILPDGGKVEFAGTANKMFDDVYGYVSWWEFVPKAVIDPHGLRTSLTYDAAGNLVRVTEPAGRYLEITYVSGRIARVDARYAIGTAITTTQTVSYGYTAQVFGASYTLLTTVGYVSDAGVPTASYTYQASNLTYGAPLISTCNDFHYAGPMKKIAYDFERTSPTRFYGQLLREKHPNGTAVATLAISGGTRTETRGDGPSRSFTYGTTAQIGYSIPRSYLIADMTDFKGNRTYLSYDANGFVNKSKNPRGAVTSFARLALTGNLSSTTLPPDVNGLTATITSTFADPATGYYPATVKNERGFTTSFTRGAGNRVTRIDYPNTQTGAAVYETFTYNGFGQVLAHRMASGGTESFTYDARGLKKTYTPPATPSDANPGAHPTRYAYDAADQLSDLTDPRGNNTSYDYDAPSRATRVTHQDGTYSQTGYNTDSTVAWTADENHPGAATDATQRTRYTYDDYKRVVTVTDPEGNVTTRDYTSWGTGSSYLHTSSFVFRLLLPSGKNIAYEEDGNFQLKHFSVAWNTPEQAWTYYEFDAAGNRTQVKDPRGNITTFAYDLRNRRTSATDPAPFTNQVTRWEYDQAGNVTKETRPDGKFRTAQFDPMSRVVRTVGFGGEGTDSIRDEAGNVTDMIDAKGTHYYTVYDDLSRKTSMTYPPDARPLVRTETFAYDFAGNLASTKTPYGWVKTFTYDNRNRAISAVWNTTYGQNVSTTYDPGNRVTKIVSGPTTVAFGYDDANRKIWEDQTLTGLPTQRVNTPVNADGYRTGLSGSFYNIAYTYTQRNQLAGINSFFEYTYDAAGNPTKRRKIRDATYDSTLWTYDALGRVTECEQTGAGDVRFALTHYQYDLIGRLQDRYEDGTNIGERFTYDTTDQLQRVLYNAVAPWNAAPTGYTRDVSYTNTALNRSSVNADGVATNYTPNEMNQYTAVTGQAPGYDGNFHLYSYDGWSYVYDADKRLTSATGPAGASAQFVYDGLGRCVKRTINGVAAVFTYDSWNPILEWDGAGNFEAWNVYGAGADEILMRHSLTGGNVVYHADPRGDVKFLLDWSGNVAEKYTYDAFGEPTVTNWDGSGARKYSRYGNRFMFTGREWLSELGLYDYRNRFYHPELGRFLQVDPIGFAGGDMNLFRYCGGDPVNNTDPDGSTVRFAGGAVHAAINYLMHSGTFSAIYAGLNTSSNVYRITTNYSLNNGRFYPGSAGGEVVWNPNGWRLMSNGGVASPEMVLAHELAGHAENYDVNGLEQFGIDLQTLRPDDYHNAEEYNAVQTETKIADELGQSTRSDHLGWVLSFPLGFQPVANWTSNSGRYYSWAGPTITGSFIPKTGIAPVGFMTNGKLVNGGGPFDPGSRSFNLSAWYASYGVELLSSLPVGPATSQAYFQQMNSRVSYLK